MVVDHFSSFENPKLGLIKIKYCKHEWLADYTSNTIAKVEWIERLNLSTSDERNKHLHTIRNIMWQEVQDFTLGGWWFLRNRLYLNPYCPNIIGLIRRGASITDLAPGMRPKSDGFVKTARQGGYGLSISVSKFGNLV